MILAHVMRALPCVTICFSTLCVPLVAGEKDAVQAGRKRDLCCVRLSDGSRLSISREPSPDGAIFAELCSKDGMYRLWFAEKLAPAPLTAETKGYYALAKATEDRVFLFFTWNSRYCVIDRDVGSVLQRGKGDEVLEHYDELMPLKLSPPPTPKLANLTQREQDEMNRRMLAGEQHASAAVLYQDIPGATLQKVYVVRFDTTGSKRRPIAVIVWKANPRGASLSLTRLDDAAPTISINGHVVKPAPTKEAVYALQPDYSLKELPLSREEVTRLFSHIVHTDEHRTRHTDDSFPQDSYWEAKVDSWLKVVGGE
jgi:hypothetical protein